MQALKELFSSDVGLMSLATLGIIIGMAAYFIRYFLHHMHEDEAKLQKH
ncbi:DUF3149 domain-containing protein [Aquabacterium sp.]